jgi:similar to stage IV sporulation protein
MSAHTASFFLRRCAAEHLEVSVVSRGGIPHLLYQYRRRIGLLIGAILGALIAAASSCVLWDIRISGNETMTLRQVREELRQSGLHIGMPMSALDAGEMGIRIQLDSEYISWASVNMSGTVAYVEIRERVPTPAREPLQPANLVAECEGVIAEMEIYSGVPAVTVGQAVRQGDLLVSGVRDGRLEYAEGEILGRVKRTVKVTVPLEKTVTVTKDKKTEAVTLILFGKRIRLKSGEGKTVTEVSPLWIGNNIRLPIAFERSYSFAVEEKTGSCSTLTHTWMFPNVISWKLFKYEL